MLGRSVLCILCLPQPGCHWCWRDPSQPLFFSPKLPQFAASLNFALLLLVVASSIAAGCRCNPALFDLVFPSLLICASASLFSLSVCCPTQPPTITSWTQEEAGFAAKTTASTTHHSVIPQPVVYNTTLHITSNPCNSIQRLFYSVIA